MKNKVLILAGLLCTSMGFSQVIKVQAGASVSKLNYNYNALEDTDFYESRLIGNAVFVGMDYFDKGFLNLSSNIGLVKKGGKSDVEQINLNGDPTGSSFVEKQTLNYLSLNTMLTVKHGLTGNMYPFLSMGPRLDILLNQSELFTELKKNDNLNTSSIGMVLGGGILMDVSDLQLGFHADYYLDFNKVAEWQDIGIFNTGGEATINTFVFTLSLGYRL